MERAELFSNADAPRANARREHVRSSGAQALSLRDCKQLTNASAVAVLTRVPGLWDLCLFGCRRMTNE